MNYKNLCWQSLVILALGILVFVSGCTDYTDIPWKAYASPSNDKVLGTLILYSDSNKYDLSIARTGQDINTGALVISGYDTFTGSWYPTSDNHFIMDLSETSLSNKFRDPKNVECMYDPNYPRINIIDSSGNSIPVFYRDFETYQKNTPPVVPDGPQPWPVTPGPTEIVVHG